MGVTAGEVIREIYEYRTMIKEYQPRNPIREEKVRKLMEEVEHDSHKSHKPTAEEGSAEALPGVRDASTFVGSSMNAENPKAPLLASKEGEAEVEESPPLVTRRGIFAKTIEEIHRNCMQGDMKTTAMTELDDTAFNYMQEELARQVEGASIQALQHEVDDGISRINALEYVEFRLRPSMERFAWLASAYSCRASLLQLLIFFATTTSAFLGMIGETNWIPVSVSLASSLVALLDYYEYGSKLTSINLAITQFENILTWWESLSVPEKALPKSRERLVEVTENAVAAEYAWAAAVGGEGSRRMEGSQKVVLVKRTRTMMNKGTSPIDDGMSACCILACGSDDFSWIDMFLFPIDGFYVD